MALYLYHFTLQKAPSITRAVYGNFSDPKAQEVVVVRAGHTLELLRPDEHGRVHTVLSQPAFGLIRDVRPFRLTGGTKDYIVLGTDSGRITILEYNPETNTFDKVHEETFGRSGVRRIVPGQYLAADPKGRAVMISAFEKQKFVYILNRDSAAKLTISSPLEAHKANTIVFDVVGVDVGFENPIFAAIEYDYEEPDSDPTGEAIESTEKCLTFYELDLGLNHVTRQSSEPVPADAHLLIPLPGAPDGPGGVLVCCPDRVLHRSTAHDEVDAAIPRRRTLPDGEPTLVTSWALVKQRAWYFVLLQTEHGDVFKVSVERDGDDVTALSVKYFDTLPVATSMAVLKTGFLFLASDCSANLLYRFVGIGDDDEDVLEAMSDAPHPLFRPRALRNLEVVDQAAAAAPVADMLVENLCGEETPQVLLATGKGERSALRVLRPGLAVGERAASALPAVPSAVWSLPTSRTDPYHKYIVVSFKDATMVLSIGDSVQEVHDSGLLGTVPTLHAALLGDDQLVQVYPDGLRHIRQDGRVHEWKPPATRRIRAAAANERQVALSLGGGDVVYFELDPTGQLVEIEKAVLGREVVALALAPVPAGRQRARFLAVADADNSMRVYSLQPSDLMQSLAMQVLPARVTSLCIQEMGAFGTRNLFVHAGLSNGVLVRATMDRVTGELSDTRARFLGARAVKLFPLSLAGDAALLALSSRSWLLSSYQRRFTVNPLAYPALECAAHFASEQCPEGVVSIAGDTLRIFTLEQQPAQTFNQTLIPLRHTPRRMLVDPQTRLLVVAESDPRAYSESERAALLATLPGAADAEGAVGAVRAGSAHWAACLRIVDVARAATVSVEDLGNEHVMSMCWVEFANQGGESLLVVGTVEGLAFAPRRTWKGASLRVYRLVDSRTRLQLLHRTELTDTPGALTAFQGRLLAGVGGTLRIYDLGKKKLLRKCENKELATLVSGLWVTRDRIVLADQQFSHTIVKYNRAQNLLYSVADDPVPRWTTSSAPLDSTTLAAGDKFGNVYTLRVPDHVERVLAEDPTGGTVQLPVFGVNGAPNKLIQPTAFHVGETVTKILKTQLTPGGREAVVYATVFGALGVLVPFQSREDVDFFTNLEMHMRQEYRSLVGRDHLSYRSTYVPVKAVIDGDYCEQFLSLPSELQRKIASALDRTPVEVQKKLEDLRNSL